MKRTWHYLCHFEWFWWSIDNAINGTNMIVKMTILRLLGSSDDKEKRRLAQLGPKNRRMSIGASDGCRKNRRHSILVQKEIEAKSAYKHRMNRWFKKGASVHWAYCVPETMQVAQEPSLQHRLNRWSIGAYHRCNNVSCQEFNGYFGLWVTGWTDATPARGIGSSDDTQIFCWPLEQRLQDLVAYIYTSPRPFEACWSC